jgi:hypothetical protein
VKKKDWKETQKALVSLKSDYKPPSADQQRGEPKDVKPKSGAPIDTEPDENPK